MDYLYNTLVAFGSNKQKKTRFYKEKQSSKLKTMTSINLLKYKFGLFLFCLGTKYSDTTKLQSSYWSDPMVVFGKTARVLRIK